MRRGRGLKRLKADPDPTARSLAGALEATVRMELTDDERVWVERIERWREQLNASEAAIHHRLSEWTGERAHHERILVNTIGDVSRRKSQPPLWGLFLFRLVRTFKPATCLELGTGVGISAAYQAAALALNGGGRLVTLEALESRVAQAREGLEALGLEWVEVRTGRFQDVLDDVLPELGTVNFAFIDGHHAEAATVHYFGRIASFLSEHGLLLFDDITWSDGMRRAWKTISADRRVAFAVDLGRAGICIQTPRQSHSAPVIHAVPLG